MDLIRKNDYVDIELDSGNIHRSWMTHSIGKNDALANAFGVRVFRGGYPADLEGAVCEGFFRNAEGTNILITETAGIEGNIAYVALPQACYNVEGQFCLAIKLIGGGVTGTMRIVDGMVDNTNTSSPVAPTETVPTYQEILAVYAEMQEAVDDYDDVVAAQDAKIDDVKSTIDDVNNWFADETGVKHYFFTNGGWIPTTTSSVDPSTVVSNGSMAYCVIECQPGDVFNIKASGVNSSHRPYSFIDSSNAVLKQATSNSVNSAQTAPANSAKLVVNASKSADHFVIKNKSRLTECEKQIATANENFSIITENGINLFDVRQFNGDSGITVNGSEISGSLSDIKAHGSLIINGNYQENTQYTIQMEAYNESTGSSIGMTVAAYYTDETDERLISYNRTQASYLRKYATTASGKTVRSLIIGYSNGQNDVWHIKNIQIETGNILTPYSGRIYSAVDELARGRGNALVPTGEDQTQEILYRLRNYGVCNLGKGEYVVDNLIMPEGSVLSGFGDSSVIKLADTAHQFILAEPKSSSEGVGYIRVLNSETDGVLPPGLYTIVLNVATEYTGTTTSRIAFLKGVSYSSDDVIRTVDVGRGEDKTVKVFLSEPIKSIWALSGHVTSISYSITVSKFDMKIESTAVIMGKSCTVKDISLVGADEAIELTGTIGKRHGIGWFIPANQYGVITGCRISDFEGSAILMEDTSTPTDHSALISNCHLSHNMVGIYIHRNSEFNKIINCGITRNYYGCLNRGGNNIFSNCGFDSNVVGMQVDADAGDNQGHGSISNCTFNHSDSNTGYGLIVKGTGRELIGNCQFWYSNIRLQSTNGNVINGCEFGNDAVIEIAGSGSGTSCNMVIGCMMRSGANTITIYNDIKSKVINCWTRDGNEVLPTVSDEPI